MSLEIADSTASRALWLSEAEDGREFAQLLHQIIVPRGGGEERDQFKQFHHRQNEGDELGGVREITPLSCIKI